MALTQELKDEIVRRYKAGQSYRFIQYALDTSNDTIKRTLIEAGVVIRPKGKRMDIIFGRGSR